MDGASSKGTDEGALTKGQRRKLNALRKSVGEEIGEQAFVQWLSAQSGAAKGKPDGNAATIVDTLWPLVEGGSRRTRLRQVPQNASNHLASK